MKYLVGWQERTRLKVDYGCYVWCKVQTCRTQKGETDYSHGELGLNSICQIWKDVQSRTAEMSAGSSKLKVTCQH